MERNKMAEFELKADDVQAAKLDATTGDITIGDTTYTAGNWIVCHADGTLTAVDDATFTAAYQPAPPAPDVPVDAPAEETPVQ
jgi:hypothetical protein